MNRGSIYWVNLEPSNPPEFGKTRPALIVSNSEQNSLLPTVVVVPLSSKAPEIWPLRIKIELSRKKSYAVIPGIRQVNKTRLMDLAGQASLSEIKEIESAILAYLGD